MVNPNVRSDHLTGKPMILACRPELTVLDGPLRMLP
jgi:hypothetical protein